MLLSKLILECLKIGVSLSDLMQKKNSTKSGTLLDLALVCGLVSMQDKH